MLTVLSRPVRVQCSSAAASAQPPRQGATLTTSSSTTCPDHLSPHHHQTPAPGPEAPAGGVVRGFFYPQTFQVVCTDTGEVFPGPSQFAGQVGEACNWQHAVKEEITGWGLGKWIRRNLPKNDKQQREVRRAGDGGGRDGRGLVLVSDEVITQVGGGRGVGGSSSSHQAAIPGQSAPLPSGAVCGGASGSGGSSKKRKMHKQQQQKHAKQRNNTLKSASSSGGGRGRVMGASHSSSSGKQANKSHIRNRRHHRAKQASLSLSSGVMAERGEESLLQSQQQRRQEGVLALLPPPPPHHHHHQQQQAAARGEGGVGGGQWRSSQPDAGVSGMMRPHLQEHEDEHQQHPGFGEQQQEQHPPGSGMEYMRLTPLTRKYSSSAHLRVLEARGAVKLSQADKAQRMLVGEDGLSVRSQKGYRMVRSTHGVTEGAFYCEVTVTTLGLSGHVRLGWATRRSELNAPVGYDSYGYGYRDLGGLKVHQGRCTKYGESFKEGDVIGMYIYLPQSDNKENSVDEPCHERVRWYGKTFAATPLEKSPQELGVITGSVVGFSLNGQPQGVAFQDLITGKYHPTISLYTNITEQPDTPAESRINFGPKFAFPPQVGDFAVMPRPMCQLAANSRSLSKSVDSHSFGSSSSEGS